MSKVRAYKKFIREAAGKKERGFLKRVQAPLYEFGMTYSCYWLHLFNVAPNNWYQYSDKSTETSLPELW